MGREMLQKHPIKIIQCHKIFKLLINDVINKYNKQQLWIPSYENEVNEISHTAILYIEKGV